MNIEIIMIILLATVIVETIVVVVSLLAFNNELKFAVAYMKNHSEFMQSSLQDTQAKSQKQAEEIGENIRKELVHYRQKSDEQNEMYKQFENLIKAMIERMKTIEENYKKLLDCWKGINERYDQTYDQFKLAVNKLDELHLKIEDLSCLTTEDEYRLTLNEACDTVCLDCPYENCLRENCPVYTIMQRDFPEKTNRVCDLNDYYKCPYKECVHKDCPIFVEKSVTTPGFDDPLFGEPK